ncbi:unnamed protein product [Ceratitis capitata]|uniref:(Mediterranean fruit fly) hypothetical protein n=1 Tax=Ceratitis capitata TaxID=7213 RepID=A0A811UEA5_CERCA|nr:unnamed protein product [Ceratitis capitata]
MIWFKNVALLAFLLAISIASIASVQGSASGTAAEPQDEDTIDLTPSADPTSEKNQDNRGDGQIVGQSLLTPLLGQGLLPAPLNMFSSMFPALNSLLLLGNLFPGASLMGPPSLLGSTQQMGPSATDESPAASKVVLVLAEDRNPHVAMRVANQEAARTIRQNDMLSQMLNQFGQVDFGQMLSQSLEQMQLQNPGQLLQQNPGQLLQQIVPQDLSQPWSQLLSQTFQQIPGLDLSQFPLIGQAPTSSEPTVGAAMESAGGEGAAPAADAPASAPQQAFQFPNFQTAIDAGTQMLGQALQQPNSDPTGAFQLPNIQSALDAGTQMLGQAFQQANSDSSTSGFQLPNIQSVIDSGNQMLSQSGGLFNFRPLQSLDPATSASDAEPAASQISEVRVKPEDLPLRTTFNQQQAQKDEKMDDLKMMSALQKAILHKKLPILWFHIPTDSSERNHDFGSKTYSQTNTKSLEEMQLETKLQAFQRQVVTELKLLQDIERKAKELRSAAKGSMAKTFKDNNSSNESALSKIPIHKITRGDIEKALNDDYVKKLLHKTAITTRKETSNSPFEQLLVPSSMNIKRQTMQSTMKPRQMTREDIIRLMAYAYRMANANGIRMLDSSENMKTTQDSNENARQSSDNSFTQTYRQWANDARTPSQMADMRPTAKQWMDEEMQMSHKKKIDQIPTRIPMERQMEEKIERQWAEEQTQPQRFSMKQNFDTQAPHNAQQRQWVNQKSDITALMQQHPLQQMPIMMQQPQMVGQQTPMAMQQWHMVEQTQKDQPQQMQTMMQQPLMVGQQTPMAMQQRQMVEQTQKDQPQQMQTMMQQPLMVGQQTPMTMQQLQMEHEMQQHQPQQIQTMMHQPQMVGLQTPMTMQQGQMVEQTQKDQPQQMQTMMQQPLMVGQQTPMTMQHRQMVDQFQQHQPQQMQTMMQQPQMVGQQTPMAMQQWQMVEQTQKDQPQQMQTMVPDIERQMQEENMIGEAMPQMPENAEKARHKGWPVVDEFDIFGVGGGRDHKKKHKGGPLRPTVINYYYNAGGRGLSYGGGTGYVRGGGAGYGSGSTSYTSNLNPSYGTSYGGGAGGSYSGNSAAGSYTSGYPAASSGLYRTAVGDEEIRAMLKEHSQMKMMPEPDRNPVITTDMSTTSPFQSTTSSIDDINQQDTTSYTTSTETPLKNQKKNRTTAPSTTIEVTPSPATFKLSRLDCKLELNSILDKGKSNGRDCIRCKRNANYGTLQAIDARSLNELRKTFKESLKEITLNPDEDPTEALMRYNAASIREALEQANRAPMEVIADDVGMSTMKAHNNEAYYDGIQLPALNHIQTQSNAVPQLNMYAADGLSQHNHYKLSVEPAKLQPHEKPHQLQQENLHHFNNVESQIKVADREIATAQTTEGTTASSKDEMMSPIFFSGRSESELTAILDLIKQQMQTCCDKCRDRIIANIKANIKETHSHESSLKESQQQVAETGVRSKAATVTLKSKSEQGRDDELFEKWLREMEEKGYDSKYLTKSHHWEYLNSGKLALALETNEGEQEGENSITKKTSDQSFKRYTPLSSVKTDEQPKSKKLNTSNKSTGKAFAKKIPELNYSIKEHVHVVNDKLRHLKPHSEEVTSSPYAMRGKFKNNFSKKHIVTGIATTPVKFNAISQQQSPTTSPVDENKAKVVELLSLLYDLNPRTESTASNKATQLSYMVTPLVASTTMSSEQVATTSRARTKRVRSRRKQKIESNMPTAVEQNSVVRN